MGRKKEGRSSETGGTPHPLVCLARDAIEAFVLRREVIAPRPSCPEMRGQAGVFVSIKKHGQLRGCIGTFEPCCRNVAEEIVKNAISSAMADPRFLPIGPEELPYLTISVDVLTSPEPVEDASQLDPKRYGVIVELKGRRGLLLPDLEGVDTVEKQLEIACLKAGIPLGAPFNLFCFQVRRYH